jgi:threonine/homoserine/homoserine lactone efflux protein
MIAPELILPYLIASLICIAAPGSDSLGTLSIGLGQGRSKAMAFAAGVGAGCVTHTLWAALGVAAIVQSSATLFSALKVAGALYLIYLGVMSWAHADDALRAANKNSRSNAVTQNSAPDNEVARYIWRGFLSNALNPKVMLFFLAFLPQFVDVRIESPVWMQMTVMGLGFGFMTALSYIGLGWASGAASHWIAAHPAVLRWINRFAGIMFIGLAARLLIAERK